MLTKHSTSANANSKSIPSPSKKSSPKSCRLPTAVPQSTSLISPVSPRSTTHPPMRLRKLLKRGTQQEPSIFIVVASGGGVSTSSESSTTLAVAPSS